MAHVRQSGPDSGLGFQVEMLKTFVSVPLGSGNPDNGVTFYYAYHVSAVTFYYAYHVKNGACHFTTYITRLYNFPFRWLYRSSFTSDDCPCPSSKERMIRQLKNEWRMKREKPEKVIEKVARPRDRDW